MLLNFLIFQPFWFLLFYVLSWQRRRRSWNRRLWTWRAQRRAASESSGRWTVWCSNWRRNRPLTTNWTRPRLVCSRSWMISYWTRTTWGRPSQAWRRSRGSLTRYHVNRVVSFIENVDNIVFFLKICPLRLLENWSVAYQKCTFWHVDS